MLFQFSLNIRVSAFAENGLPRILVQTPPVTLGQASESIGLPSLPEGDFSAGTNILDCFSRQNRASASLESV